MVTCVRVFCGQKTQQKEENLNNECCIFFFCQCRVAGWCRHLTAPLVLDAVYFTWLLSDSVCFFSCHSVQKAAINFPLPFGIVFNEVRHNW